MTRIIKEVTLKEIKRLQEEYHDETDLVKMTIDLQSRIIINCIVGMGYSQMKVPFEAPDGKVSDVSI